MLPAMSSIGRRMCCARNKRYSAGCGPSLCGHVLYIVRHSENCTKTKDGDYSENDDDTDGVERSTHLLFIRTGVERWLGVW